MPTYQSVKNVRCPNCQSVLAVPNRKNQAQITFSCPKCKNLLVVKFHEVEEIDTDPTGGSASSSRRNVPVEAHTVAAPNPSTVSVPVDKWPQTPGTLLCNGEASLLHIGKNTCGRRTPSSYIAQHQFAVDRSVSKEHFNINVKKHIEDTYLVTISLYKPQVSRTTVDNLPLQYGDEVVLRDGSMIVAGHTIFTYTSKQ